MLVFRRLRLLSRRERSGVPVGGDPGVRHHQAEDQRVVSPSANLQPHGRVVTGRSRRTRAHLLAVAGFVHMGVKGEEERDVKLTLKNKKQKKKRDGKWHSLSDVVDHCAFCGPAGGNVSNHFSFDLKTCSKREEGIFRESVVVPKQSPVQSTKN